MILSNVTDHCHMVGVEQYWRACRAGYKTQVDFYKAKGWSWDQRALVERTCVNVGDPYIRECGKLGVKAVMKAELPDPDSN